MFVIQNIVFLNDIVRLPKVTLKEICTDLNLEDNGSTYDLAGRVWNYIHENRGRQNEALERCKGKLLAGQTAVTWYELEGSQNLEGFADIIREAVNGFDPFERINVPSPETLTTEPVLIAAAVGNNEGEYYLRYMYKSGIRRDPYGTEMRVSPRSEITTVFVNENTGIIEVRTEPKKADKVAASLARLIGQQITLDQIVAPYGQQIEQIADSLNGELIDATSKPEFILENFTDQHAQAVVNILSSLDKFLKTNDIAALEEDLKQANEAFDEDMLTIPFAALILNGMEKVGLGGERELRGLPLYDSLNPYLQHQGGYIRFNYPENGIEKSFTVKVGLTTKSIYFNTPATEEVIDFVRRNVII